MSSLKLYGSTSGYVEIVPEATAGNNSVTLPNTAGSIAVKDASGNLEVGTGVTIAAPSSDTFTVSTNGSERIRVDSSGRLAIGDTAPESILHLKGSNATLKIESSVNTGYSGLEFDRAADDTHFAIYAYDSSHSTQANNVQFYGYQNGSLSFHTNNNERARLDSSGRLLVGTATALSAGGWAQYGKITTQGNTANSAGTGIISLARGEGAATITSNEDLGAIAFTDNAGNEFGTITCAADANAGSGDYPGRLVLRRE
jgi:hypothetical protein